MTILHNRMANKMSIQWHMGLLSAHLGIQGFGTYQGYLECPVDYDFEPLFPCPTNSHLLFRATALSN